MHGGRPFPPPAPQHPRDRACSALRPLRTGGPSMPPRRALPPPARSTRRSCRASCRARARLAARDTRWRPPDRGTDIDGSCGDRRRNASRCRGGRRARGGRDPSDRRRRSRCALRGRARRIRAPQAPATAHDHGAPSDASSAAGAGRCIAIHRTARSTSAWKCAGSAYRWSQRSVIASSFGPASAS